MFQKPFKGNILTSLKQKVSFRERQKKKHSKEENVLTPFKTISLNLERSSYNKIKRLFVLVGSTSYAGFISLMRTVQFSLKRPQNNTAGSQLYPFDNNKVYKTLEAKQQIRKCIKKRCKSCH